MEEEGEGEVGGEEAGLGEEAETVEDGEEVEGVALVVVEETLVVVVEETMVGVVVTEEHLGATNRALLVMIGLVAKGIGQAKLWA